MVAVAITRLELSPAELRAHAAANSDADAARRTLAIALILEDYSRAAAARICAMDRQTLRDWVHRYNAEGLAGLSDRPRTATPRRRLNAEQEAQVAAWVEAGPDPSAQGGLVRWRRIDLRDRIAREYGVAFHERSIGKLLDRLEFSHMSVRPQHPLSDEAAQETFKKTLPSW
jgi:transposase